MFDRIKNLKIVQKIKETVSPRSRWQEYSQINNQLRQKSSTDYLRIIKRCKYVFLTEMSWKRWSEPNL